MSAVMDALIEVHPKLHFHIYSRVPEWFFSTLASHISFHELRTDVGFIQKDALHSDVSATRLELESFMIQI